MRKAAPLSVLAALLAGALLVSCSSQQQPPSSGGKVLLGFNLKKGQVYKTYATTDQTITQTVNGREQEIKQSMGQHMACNVLDVDAEGAVTMKTTFERFTFKMQTPQGTIEYDSADPPANVPPAATGFHALVGQGFTMKMTRSGKVKEIQGVNEMFDHMMKKIQLPAAQKEAMGKMLKEQFGERAMNELWEKSMTLFPDRPVGVGDSWSSKVSVTRGMPMVLENVWRLKEIKKDSAVIEMETSIDPNPSAEPMVMGPQKITYALSGKQSGTIEVDLETGWAKSGRLHQEISGDLTIEVGGEKKIVPLSVKSEIVMGSEK